MLLSRPSIDTLWNDAVFTMEGVPLFRTAARRIQSAAVHNFQRDPNRPVGGAGAVAGRARGP
jgi:hypothetical protein